MENSRWLTILLIGLILAGVVLGYFLIRNTFLSGQTTPKVPAASPQAQATPPSPTPADFILGENTQQPGGSFPTTTTTTPTAPPLQGGIAQVTPIPSPSPSSRTSGGIKATILPNTGLPAVFVTVSSVLAMAVGWKLRRYPNS